MSKEKRSFLTVQELEYVRSRILTDSDFRIAEHLKRDIRTIKSAREKLGVIKKESGQIREITNSDPLAFVVGYKLTEDQRKEFFKTQFVNSIYYKNLLDQFTADEVNFYLEEWAALISQFQDIAGTEKRQIDELIKAEILGNRILRNVKVAEDEIKLVQQEMDDLRKAKDVNEDEDAQERDSLLMNMIRSIYSQSQAMSGDYQRNVDLRSKILNELNARRRDRVDQIKRGGTTFIGLVESMRDRKVREVQGRHAELVRLAKEKKRGEWNKPTMFPDGSKDCVLMDENSQIGPDAEIVEEKWKIIEKYKNLSGQNILIVEDDIERDIFFGGLFKGNNLTFASNLDKFKTAIKQKTVDGNNIDFQLICLDFDLGMDDKGLAAVNYILNKNLFKNTDFLIHSMNMEGASKMYNILYTERNTEMMRFYDILSHFKNKELNSNITISNTEEELTNEEE